MLSVKGKFAYSLVIFISLFFFCTGSAHAERVIDIISADSGGLTGDFTHPAGFSDGTTVHAVFVDNASSFYYCPLDGGIDFNDDTLPASDVLLKDIQAFSTPLGGAPTQPSLFKITHNNVVKAGVVFLADNTPYFTLINPHLDDTLQPEIEPAVGIIDLSSLLSTISNPPLNPRSIYGASDGGGRVHLLYTNGNGDISYAFFELDFDTGSLVGTPVGLVTPLDSTTGTPQLIVKTDSLSNAHAGWANEDSGAGICYYANIDPESTTVPGLVLIPRTRVFGQDGTDFTAPWISVNSSSSIFYSSLQSSNPLIPGEIYLANMNPNLAPLDGTALTDPDDIFSGFPQPLAPSVDFLNPLILSDSENRVHISGLGINGTGLTFATAQYSAPNFTTLQSQAPVSLVDLPNPTGIFDHSLLAYFSSGKAVLAWSGDDTPLTGNDNHIFITSTTAPAFPPQPQNESGCSVSGGYGPSSLDLPIIMVVLWFLLLAVNKCFLQINGKRWRVR